MRTKLGVLFIAGVFSCATETVEPGPFNGSINGSCNQSLAITLEEHAGSGMAEKTLALTFDDGPAESTSELSRFLKGAGIAATFFLNGTHVDGREAVLDQQLADGHLLANHTHTHAALTTISEAEVLSEVSLTDKLLAGRVAADKLYFRPPFGDWNASVMQVLSGSAMQKYRGPIGWDIGDKITESSAADWDCWDEENGTRTVEQCGDLYLKEIRAKKRGVVLLHDGPPGGNGAKTVAMVKYIVPLLKAEGYSFARIDQVRLEPHGAAAGPPGSTPGSASAGCN
ncbi:MAG TPA: polysaccharide deacetylase family protein [Labilithrix sp.]|nr:polysaccharide deacetylase family protein [Labilithrix sp.]